MKNNRSKLTQTLILVSILFIPLLTVAQFGHDIESFLSQIGFILNRVIPVLMILATIIFLWGVIMYVVSAGDEDKKATSKAYILWGLVGLAIMVAVWGLVNIINASFGIGGERISPGPRQ